MNRRRERWFLRLLVAAALAAPGLAAIAQSTVRPAPVVAPEEGPRWAALSASERTALAPLQTEWPRIDADRKQKWVEVAQRFPSLSSAERTRIQARMTEWVKMSPAERGRARLQFQETRQFTPEDRQARWEAYQALPPSERSALAAKAAPATSGTRPAPVTARPAVAAGGSDKRNVVTAPTSRPVAKTVAPTVVQTAPGATTTLVSKPVAPPAHHQPGLPKIAATKGFVDPATLLPTRGPQGAAIAATGPASGAAEHP